MTQVERDLILLGALGCFLQEEGYNLHDVIKDLDEENLSKLFETTGLFKEEDNKVKEIVFDLAKEYYGRIKENF